MLTDRSNAEPLVNVPKAKKPKRRMRALSPRRRREVAEYGPAARAYLAANPVCEVWLREYGFERREDGYGSPGKAARYSAEDLISAFLAPASTEIHHQNKRRGKRLNEQEHWLAVCRENHRRIEDDKEWARREGLLLNF